MSEQDDQDLFSEDKRKVSRLLDYCKYVYEEEKERRDVLNQMTKVYLWAIAVAIGIGIFKIGSIQKVPDRLREMNESGILGKYLALIAENFLVGSSFMFFLAFVLAISVIKMWKREGLCDLESVVNRAVSFESEGKLMSTMIADFVVATKRNSKVNDRKARLLSYAMIFFLTALFLSGSALITIYYFF